MPQSGVAAAQIRLLLPALSADCAYVTRQKYDLVEPPAVPGAVSEKLQRLRIGHIAATGLTTDQLYTEIRGDIDRYMHEPDPTA